MKLPKDRSSISLLIALLLLIYPLFNLISSIYFLNNSIEATAKVVEYRPEFKTKAGGLKELSDYYKISFGENEKEFFLGVRRLAKGKKKEDGIKEAKLQEGDLVQVLYLPDNPEGVLLKPEVNPVISVYNSSENIAFLYMLKLFSVTFMLYAFIMWLQKRSKKQYHY